MAAHTTPLRWSSRLLRPLALGGALAALFAACDTSDPAPEPPVVSEPEPAGTPELTAGPLVDHAQWAVQAVDAEQIGDHRPDVVDCAADAGWLIEELNGKDVLEVRTGACNYLSLAQPVLRGLAAGDRVEISFSHSRLEVDSADGSEAHVGLALGGAVIWEKHLPIPSASGVYREVVTLEADVAVGDALEFHLHNHGVNAYTLHGVERLSDDDAGLVFDSTFEAIQEVIFDRGGCLVCHGSDASGGLDLSHDVAYDNLVDVKASQSTLLLVEPKQVHRSYLYQKLAERTDPGHYTISGAPMPPNGAGLTAGQLEVLRMWIAAGAPRTGSVLPTDGQGIDYVEDLLGVDLPEATPVAAEPLPPPAPEEGFQIKMPVEQVAAESDTEICSAVYYDFRDMVPPEYLSPDKEFIYIDTVIERADPYTHHLVFMHSQHFADKVDHPGFGVWSCVGGATDGTECDPLNLGGCGEGVCRSTPAVTPACIGYGPSGADFVGNPNVRIEPRTGWDGFYREMPSHGIYLWNSHTFNLTSSDATHRAWYNINYAEDRRFRMGRAQEVAGIYAAAGVPPFTVQTVCRETVIDEGTQMIALTSHTHKRGALFTAHLGGEEIYRNTDYADPIEVIFDPPLVFTGTEAERTIEYCGEFSNGVNSDGSLNPDTVTRASRRPSSAVTCAPKACVTGKIGEPCSGVSDHAACDSSPGAADGFCDACAITPGNTADDEMFILNWLYLETATD